MSYFTDEKTKDRIGLKTLPTFTPPLSGEEKSKLLYVLFESPHS